MSDVQAELALVSTLIVDSRTNIYAQLASLALVLYDYFLTFPMEVELIWKRRWSISTGLYIINRYSGIFALSFNTAVYINNTFSDNFCFHWVRYEVGSSIIAFWLVDIILAFRVWALWGKSKRVLFFICLLFSMSVGACVTVTTLVFRHITVLHRPGPFASGCYPLGFPTYTYAIAIPELGNSGILLVLTLFRTVQSVRMGRRNAPMLTLFIRDGVLYYLCIMLLILMNAFAFSSFAITAAASGLLVALPCSLGSRILLNIRHQILFPKTQGASVHTLATMQFGGQAPIHLASRALSRGSSTFEAPPPESGHGYEYYDDRRDADDGGEGGVLRQPRLRDPDERLPDVCRVSGGGWFE